MGNIGLHYYDWRYNNTGVCPRHAPRPQTTAVAPSRRSAAARRPPRGTADRYADAQHPRRHPDRRRR